ncbi:MAG: family 16 glycoside hydrolase [Gemmataceae bacterium]
MNEFDQATLVAYTLGELPPDRAEAVRNYAATDRELAAKLSALAGCAGFTQEDETPSTSIQSRQIMKGAKPSRRTLFKQLAATIAIAVLLCGVGYAGYEWLREKPLFEDNFNDEWLDTKLWDTHRGRKGVREEGGYLRLLNRGFVVTANEFPDPIEISLDWQWIDLEGDPLYPDNFSVGLRTSGIHEKNRPFDPVNGIEVAFVPHHGGVYVQEKPVGGRLVQSPQGICKFVAGKWYHLRITDDGKRINIYVNGQGIDKKYTTEPVLTVESANPSKDHRISFFNREYVGDANHESRIDNVVIRNLVLPTP